MRTVAMATLSAVFLLAGCETLDRSVRSPGVPSNPWLAGLPACTQAVASEPTKVACTQQDALTAVAKAQSYCMDLRGYYERGGQVTGSQRLFVGVLGSLAGSVFAATAQGSAAKAWSGLSGATNAIQTQMDNATIKLPSYEVSLAVAAAQESFSTEVKVLLSNAKWSEVVSAAVLLPDACSREAGRGMAKRAKAGEEASAAAKSATAAASAAEAAASAAQSVAADAAKVSPTTPASGAQK